MCEIVIWVVVGGIVKKYFKEVYGIEVLGYLFELGFIVVDKVDYSVININLFFCFDESKLEVLDEYMCDFKKLGDSIGVKVLVVVKNVLVGLGEFVFDRLDVEIVYVMMGINVVKGVEIGDGFDVIN